MSDSEKPKHEEVPLENMEQKQEDENLNSLGVPYDEAMQIGARLQQKREQIGFSHGQCARKTKIREMYIEAIEIGDWDTLPPGLHGRGLVRIYARELQVSIPEFDFFEKLQTVQVERQSETIASRSVFKKSKYQPAAEESAEIIRVVKRSQYDRLQNEKMSLPHSEAESFQEDIRNSYAGNTTHSRTFFPKVNSSRIVTPNIENLLGVSLSNVHDKEGHIQTQTENTFESFRVPAKAIQMANHEIIEHQRLDQKFNATKDIPPYVPSFMPEQKLTVVENLDCEQTEGAVVMQVAAQQGERFAVAKNNVSKSEQSLRFISDYKKEKINERIIPKFQEFVSSAQASTAHLSNFFTGFRKTIFIWGFAGCSCIGIAYVAFLQSSDEDNMNFPVLNHSKEPSTPAKQDEDASQKENQVSSAVISTSNTGPQDQEKNAGLQEVQGALPIAGLETEKIAPESGPQASAQLVEQNSEKNKKEDVNSVLPAGFQMAKIDILSRVKVQIEADGKILMSGYQSPSSHQVNFADKAVILVHDGSKVKLSYAGWEHGELGLSERKRKIVLNAKSYKP